MTASAMFRAISVLAVLALVGCAHSARLEREPAQAESSQGSTVGNTGIESVLTLNKSIPSNNLTHFQDGQRFVARPDSIFHRMRGSVFGFAGLSNRRPYCVLVLSDFIALSDLPNQKVDNRFNKATFKTRVGSLYGNDYTVNILNKLGEKSGNALLCYSAEDSETPPTAEQVRAALGDFFTIP